MFEILNQSEFIAAFREVFGKRINQSSVHCLIANGMPVIKTLGKKPRFHWKTCRDWILNNPAPQSGSLEQKTRDRLFKRSINAAL
jgi:hypothetical protein